MLLGRCVQLQVSPLYNPLKPKAVNLHYICIKGVNKMILFFLHIYFCAYNLPMIKTTILSPTGSLLIIETVKSVGGCVTALTIFSWLFLLLLLPQAVSQSSLSVCPLFRSPSCAQSYWMHWLLAKMKPAFQASKCTCLKKIWLPLVNHLFCWF